MCSYSVIEGCVRQSSFSPIKKNMKTEMETFYDCTEEIANVIEKHYPEVYIEDMERINSLVDQEIVDAMRKQAKENYLENINGGSK